MQMCPQPLLQHLWPQEHSSSKLQRSRHVAASPGTGHTPTLPERQAPSYGVLSCGHPSMRHPGVALHDARGAWLALTSRDIHADTATAGAGAPLTAGTLRVSLALCHALCPVRALCRGTVTCCHPAALGEPETSSPCTGRSGTCGHGQALPGTAGVAALLPLPADAVVQALAPVPAPGLPAWLCLGAPPRVLCRRGASRGGCGLLDVPTMPCQWPGCTHSPRAGRAQRMAQPEKQHFSCRGQSLSWAQESSSVHGSSLCHGLTFGHSPGLSERGRKGHQGQAPPCAVCIHPGGFTLRV